MTPAEPGDYKPPPDPWGVLWVVLFGVLALAVLTLPLWSR